MSILLIILLIVLLGGGFWSHPRFGYAPATWGYAPFGGFGLIFFILLIVLLFGGLR